LVLTIAAVIADWFAPPIFGRHTLVLGLVPYWIALRYFGLMPALVVLAVSAFTLTYKWGQPYSPGVLALEGLIVGIFWRREKNAFLADVIFWGMLGIPFTWLLHTYVEPIPHPIFEQILVIQPINGFIALWITYIIVELLPPPPRGVGFKAAQTFSHFLLKRYVAFGTFPVLVAGLLAARSFEERVMIDANTNLVTSAHFLAANVSRHVAHSRTLVQEVALRQTDRAWFSDAERLSAELRAAHQSSGVFLTMLAADANGSVFATALPSPGKAPIAPLERARPVSDREYFRSPMATGKPYVSGIFRGRSFGHDAIIAVSSPVISHANERLGIIEGSLKASELNTFLRQKKSVDSSHAMLSDGAHVIIAATSPDHPPLTDLKGTALGRAAERRASVPARMTDDHGRVRASVLYVSVPVPDTNWTVTLHRPWGEVVSPVVWIYIWTLSVAAVAAALASAFSAWSIRHLLRSWKALMAFSRTPDDRLEHLDESISAELPQEFRELIQNLAVMARNLDSERNQREQLLSQLETRVQERTQQLEDALFLAQTADRAKSAFLATVTHELRTPLTAIINSTGLLKLGARRNGEPPSPALLALERSSKVLMTVISDVLDFSKLEAGAVEIERTPFHPAELLNELADILAPTAAAAQITLRMAALHTTDLAWQGDPPRVRQVLLNLLGNALKFSPAGRVTVTSAVLEAEGPLPRRLCFTVMDSGAGIPADKLEAIFEPFVQLEGNRILARAGTGLGLTISRRLAQMMGGQITVTSVVGQGSTFIFWLK
jgi:signal transduction histidine kinase